MFWFLIFDCIYTDILVKKLLSTDSDWDTDYAGIFFVGSYIKLVKKIQKTEKIFNIIYQNYEDSIYLEQLVGIS